MATDLDANLDIRMVFIQCLILTGKRLNLRSFPVARPSIQNIMSPLLDCINCNEDLYNKLFQVNFRTNSINKILVTLIYHKPLN